MVMELLEGENLGARMKRQPPLTPAEIIHLSSLTLRGLAAVHEAGIVHRDLKPENIFLKRDGDSVFPKILDFGISRSVEPASGRRSALTTKEGIIVGTPEYMSPEQARGLKTVDRRTDLYSMGVILYEAFTGVLPFSSENIGDLIIDIVTGTAPQVLELNPGISRALSDVIAQAMAKSPDDRFDTATQMQEALVAAAEGEAPARRSLSDRPPAIDRSGAQQVLDARQPLDTIDLALDASAESLELAVPAAAARPTVLEQVHEDPLADSSRRGRGPLIVALVVAAIGITFGFASLLAEEEAQAPAAVQVAPPQAQPEPEAEPVSPPAAPAATMARVHLRNVPVEATIEVDGKPVPGDTFELPTDGEPREIRVVLKGRKPWSKTHPSTGEATYDVWLAKANSAQPKVKAGQDSKTKRRLKPKRRRQRSPSALRELDF